MNSKHSKSYNMNLLLNKKEVLQSRVDYYELQLNLANKRLTEINKEIANELKG